MKRVMMSTCVWFGLLVGAVAQDVGASGAGGRDGGAPTEAQRSRPAISEAARAALSGGRELVGKLRGLEAEPRKAALEQAAAAHERIAEQLAGEPAAAASAAFAAADLWRQHGTLASAERAYLRAATLDAPRFAQRGLLGAADMQRRLGRADEALATYARAEAVTPGSARAQDARLWRARILQGTERLDEAVTAFQAALECAEGPSQVIEAANFLALAWVQKGDLDAAARAIEHAERAVEVAAEDDPVVRERQHKWLEAMSARKALQRARDQRDGAGKDAVQFDEARRGRER